MSVRTLYHYDVIGLLCPSGHSEAGYRLYDEVALVRLGHILLFRELRFSLADIKAMLDAPDFNQQAALDAQIHLLEMERTRLDQIIKQAQRLKEGATTMDYQVFETAKIDAYKKEAKALVETLQDFITVNYYHCTNDILAGLGQMYTNDTRFKKTSTKPAAKALPSSFRRSFASTQNKETHAFCIAQVVCVFVILESWR